MDWILDSISGVMAGGITGLIGTVFTTWVTYKQKQSDQAHELKLRDMDIKEREKESELTLKEISARTESEIAQAEMSAFVDSMSMDKATYARSPNAGFWMVLVDVVRGLTRPLITWVSLIIVWWLCYSIVSDLGGIASVVNKEDGLTIVLRIIDTLLYIATTSTLWWFGTRAVHKATK